jgi:hypothetical protein
MNQTLTSTHRIWWRISRDHTYPVLRPVYVVPRPHRTSHPVTLQLAHALGYVGRFTSPLSYIDL